MHILPRRVRLRLGLGESGVEDFEVEEVAAHGEDVWLRRGRGAR